MHQGQETYHQTCLTLDRGLRPSALPSDFGCLSISLHRDRSDAQRGFARERCGIVRVPRRDLRLAASAVTAAFSTRARVHVASQVTSTPTASQRDAAQHSPRANQGSGRFPG